MAKRPIPTPDELRQFIAYDPETGIMTWKHVHGANWHNSNMAGKTAMAAITKGVREKGSGYLHGKFKGVTLYAHRVAWAIHHGAWPRKSIDHIDGNGLNNAISNLRDVTSGANSKNKIRHTLCRSGHTGITASRGKWRATIFVDGRRIYIGTYADILDAVTARKRAQLQHGFTERHGESSSAQAPNPSRR